MQGARKKVQNERFFFESFDFLRSKLIKIFTKAITRRSEKIRLIEQREFSYQGKTFQLPTR